MKFPLSIRILRSLFGDSKPASTPMVQLDTELSVQLFNEAVLGSSPTDAVPLLHPKADARWPPKQIILDYKGDACYGAMVHYERSRPFEDLRSAINGRFGKYEVLTPADSPTMGIWRMEDAGFTIQLGDNEDEDTYLAIYIRFVDPGTLAIRLEELQSSDPDLFGNFPHSDYIAELREREARSSEGQDRD